MNWAIMGPLLLLIFALVGAAIALLLDGQRKKLTRRVDAVMAPGTRPAAVEQASIRISTTNEGRFAALISRLVGKPADLAAAHLVPPNLVLFLGLAAGLGVVLAGEEYLGLPFAVMAGLATGLGGPRIYFAWEVGRYRAAMRRQLPDAIEMVVSATRAGLPIIEAFRGVSTEVPKPTRDEFGRAVSAMSVGVTAADALLDIHRRTGVTEYAIFAVTLGVQGRTGGRLAETIQNLAETVRYRLATAARAGALAGEAKVSAVILCGLPFAAGLGLSLLRPGYLDPLFNDPRGIRLVYICAVGLVLGVLTMRQLIRNATSE